MCERETAKRVNFRTELLKVVVVRGGGKSRGNMEVESITNKSDVWTQNWHQDDNVDGL